MLYVVNILENLQAMSVNKEKDREMAKAALEDILNMEKRLPDDFDIEKELFEKGKVKNCLPFMVPIARLAAM